MTHFKVIMPFFNVEPWVKFSINSLRQQTHKNFECLLIDDMSTDGSCEIIEQEIKDDTRFRLIKNSEKKYGLRNYYEGINITNPRKDDVIVTLDGDDWLYNESVLEKLDTIYNKGDCWITYGNYIRYPTGELGHCTKYPDKVIQEGSYRKDVWRASQLRTFKYGLWEKINISDLKNEEGDFYSVAWDFAFMFPLLEMAAEKHVFVDQILYVYNRDNPINDDKVDMHLQVATGDKIRTFETYQRIEQL